MIPCESSTKPKNDSSEQLPGASTHEIDSLARAQFS